MNRLSFFIFSAKFLGLACIFLLNHSCAQKLNASNLLEKSLVAHGGKKALSKVSEITYLKNIKLYDSIGELEKEINQKTFILKRDMVETINSIVKIIAP